MKLTDLQERRALIVAEMRGIADKPAGNGDLSEEQNKRFDTLKAELEGVEKSLGRQALLVEAERRMAGTPVHGTGDSRLDDALRDFSLRKAICSQIPDVSRQVDCGRELELSNEIAKRAGRPFQGLAVPRQVFEVRTITSSQNSPDFGGGKLVANDHRPEQYIDILRAKLGVKRAGARVLSGLQGNVDIPKLSASAGTAWVAEDSALSDSDPTFAKITLQPKHCGALTEFSRNMLLQSSPDVEMLIRQDFAGVLANALDVAAINGSGSTQPTGILNLTGLSTVDGPLSWTKVLQMVEQIEESNTEGTAWITTPGMKRVLRSTVRVSSTDSVMIAESANSLADYPLIVTTNAPTNVGSPSTGDALIFGNWSDLLIAEWSALDILVNPFESAAYSRGNVKVRGMMTVDIAARHVESFVAMVNQDAG